jgi:hypothetical protein
MAEQPVPRAIIRGNAPRFASGSPSELPSDVVVVPTYKLYSGGQMGLATFLGGPLAGCWLLARNFKRLQRPRAARLAIGLGVVWMAALFAMALMVAFFGRLFGLFSIGLMIMLAYKTQGDAFLSHTRRGGRRSSWWAAIGIGLASLALVVVIVAAGAVAYAVVSQPSKVAFGASEVFYEDDSTEAEARAVGEWLTENDYFSTGQEASVMVHRDASRAVISFVVQESARHDKQSQRDFHALASELSKHAFSGAPLDLWLTDEYLEPSVKLPWEARPQRIELGADEVWYRDGATEAEARIVGKVLTERGELTGSGSSATVARDGRVKVAFTLAPEFHEDAATRAELHELAYHLSKALGGTPVDVLLKRPDGTELVRLAWETRQPDPIVLANGHEIFYREGGTVDQARAIAVVLADALAGLGTRETIVMREDGRAVVAFVSGDREVVDAHMHAYADQLSKQAFAGEPVDLWFLDHDLQSLATFSWESRPKRKAARP